MKNDGGDVQGVGHTDLVERGEPVHIGVVDVSAAVKQPQHLLGVAARAGGQEHGAIVELHLRLLLLQHGRLQVRLRAQPSLQLLVPLLLGVRHLHPPPVSVSVRLLIFLRERIYFIVALSHSAAGAWEGRAV